jgi:5'-3' exonuclease
MGIQGLLRNLHPLLVPPPSHPSYHHQAANDNDHHPNASMHHRKHSTANIRHNIRQFRNKSLAIDASSWLHKAAYTCAERLVESTESGTRDIIAERSYTKYMISRCDELLSSRVGIQTIYLVFDGKRVPLKSGTNAERERKRRANLEEARQLKAAGKSTEASEKYRSCVKGNDLMARVVADEVEKKWGRVSYTTGDDVMCNRNDDARVQCIWSPYEADAQLAKLCIDGYAHAVVTEDSDVLVYSAVTRQPFPIIYKLDKNDGSCDVVTMDWLVNPDFLAFGTTRSSGGGRVRSRRSNDSGSSSNNSSCSSAEHRRSRRSKMKDDLDYIYRNNPLPYDDRECNREEGFNEVVDGGTDENDTHVVHCCCVEYDDLGLAPVRRSLPPPTSQSNGKSTSQRKAASSSSSSSAGNALLAYLRSFAYKEASNPGFGVRLFVQACVLSGCDYVPNRLSKVGPVTAFKLVKEASHRDASIRFERVLKSLPAGSKLLAEEYEKCSEDGKDNEHEDDDYDDFLSLPDTDRNAKVKYEELLSKSESVFYYHLVRDLSTGKVVPLVKYNQPTRRGGDDDNDDGKVAADSLEVDERSRPCVARFNDGMTFVGSAADAMNDRPEPLPAIPATTYQHPRPSIPSHNNYRSYSNSNSDGGWISAKRQTESTLPVLPSFLKPDHRNVQSKQQSETLAPMAKDPPQEFPLQKFHVKNPQIATKKTAESNNDLKNAVEDNANDLKGAPGDNTSFGKENYDRNHSATTAATNPYATFAYDGSTKCDYGNNESTVSAATIKSPFFSPVQFDYGLYTPKDQSGIKTKTNDVMEATRPVDDVPRELHLGNNDDGGDREQPKPFAATTDVPDVTYDSNISFDFGFQTEPTRMNNFYSPEVQPGPRRVSSSPPERMNCELMRGYRTEDVIEIFDDDDDDDDVVGSSAVVPRSESRHFHPSTKSVYNATKSTVNKQQFKSPYLGATTNKRISTASASYGSKKPRPSSSALLAGFARQTNSNVLRQKQTFYPTMAKASNRQTQTTLNSFLTKVNSDE